MDDEEIEINWDIENEVFQEVFGEVASRSD
jgi:hypothetical protein